MRRIRSWVTLLTLVLAAACADVAGASGWQCDVTLTMDGRSGSGSGSGSTQQEALNQALSAACGQLGLSGNALSLCEAGQNPGAFSWTTDIDCATT